MTRVKHNLIKHHASVLQQCGQIRPLQINFLFLDQRPHLVYLLSALNIPLYRILPLFSGYSCILTGLAKAVSAHVLVVLSNFTFVLFLQLEKEGPCFCAAFIAVPGK